MNTFLPYEDFTQCAKSIDSNRLNSQYNEALVIIKSLTHVYPIKERTGFSGFENHTVGKFWKGYELALAEFMLAITEEILTRPFAKSNAAESLLLRKARRQRTRDLVEFMEDNGWDNSRPPLIGDPDFHSAFRSFLLYKDVQHTTFKNWKSGKYPDHAVTRALLPRKASWKRPTYEAIWEFFGRPASNWYGQFGWVEEPNDLLVFYSEDRIGQITKEIQRKIDRPTSLGFIRASAPNEN
jgi:hypothetical protein